MDVKRRRAKMKDDDFDSKRPDHPDFMCASELKKAEFSGIRHNSLTDQTEIWKVGEVAKVISKALMDQAVDKNAVLAMAMEDTFGIYDVAIEGMEPITDKERDKQEGKASKNVIVGLDGKTFH
jgi:hypothetical protein